MTISSASFAKGLCILTPSSIIDGHSCIVAPIYTHCLMFIKASRLYALKLVCQEVS